MTDQLIAVVDGYSNTEIKLCKFNVLGICSVALGFQQ